MGLGLIGAADDWDGPTPATDRIHPKGVWIYAIL